ncbi:MAG: hypothetical protein DI630_31835 [Gordonia sp. (in: high G+C Gram-positive bacteria)]|nr:MAG: hypothetical protein DI630_31835 [Gordonia sp. (in: high G+C Gram-positive bacteria)]
MKRAHATSVRLRVGAVHNRMDGMSLRWWFAVWRAQDMGVPRVRESDGRRLFGPKSPGPAALASAELLTY